MDLLDVLGKGYIVEHCMTALNECAQEDVFREYVTDALKAIVDNTSRYVTISGVVETGTKIPKRYADIVHPKTQGTGETSASIIDRIRTKCDRLRES